MGLSLYFFVNLYRIFDVSNYRKDGDYIINYSQGFGGVSVEFRMSHSNLNSFNSRIIFDTISSEDIEVIGIIKVDYDIYRDEQHIYFNELDFTEPILNGHDFFVVVGVDLHDNVSCVGTIDMKFDVEGIMQNETINFLLSIVMPVNPVEIRNTHLMNLIWGEFGLGVVIVVLLGSIIRTIWMWRSDSKYSEEEQKKDREFFDYIGNKLNSQRKESY